MTHLTRLWFSVGIYWVSHNLILFRHYLPWVIVRSHKLRSHSYETVPTQVVICTSNLLAVIWGSHHLLLKFNNLLEQFIELRETLISTALLNNKGYDKNTDVQPDEEIQRVRSRRVLRAGASVPMELGGVALPVHGWFHQPRSSLNPTVQGFLWRIPHIGMIDY